MERIQSTLKNSLKSIKAVDNDLSSDLNISSISSNTNNNKPTQEVMTSAIPHILIIKALDLFPNQVEIRVSMKETGVEG